MKKTLGAIALALAFGIVTLAKTHHTQQDVPHDYDADRWRHFLLHAAGNISAPVPEKLTGDDLAIITTARKFRAEFEKAIDDFNAAQETRMEADQLHALKKFLAQRDAMVLAYRSELLSSLTKDGRTWIDDKALSPPVKFMSTGPTKKSHCGLPDHTYCTITYSMADPVPGLVPGLNPNQGFSMEFNQVLDGAAAIPGNSKHSRNTPTLMWVVRGLGHDDSGKSVCENCYLYVNATMVFSGPSLPGGDWQPVKGADPARMGTNGTVVCSGTGKIFDADKFILAEYLGADSNSGANSSVEKQ